MDQRLPWWNRRPVHFAAMPLLMLLAVESFAATIVFHSKWESAVALQAPQDCMTGSPYLCWQQISGTDSSTGYTWPPQVWGSQSAYGGGGVLATTNGYPGNDGDYRFAAYIVSGCSQALVNAGISPCTGPNPNPAPFWLVSGDNNAGGSYALTNVWHATNTSVAIPDDGRWNRVQILVQRSSGSSGRFFMSINGTIVIDRWGANTGAASLPINRIMPMVLYTGGKLPAYQWTDDIEIWMGMP